MAEGKWITDLTATTPIADAARRVLALRLELVRDALPAAQHQAHKDPEYVHQLRVATRRAGAALEIFSLCLPDKDYRAAKRHLRQIRRAAGEARDWDVFLDGLAAGPKPTPRYQAGIDFLFGFGAARRIVAQSTLEAASPNYPFAFERFLAETVAAVHKPRAEPEVRVLLDLAQPMLVRLLKELHTAASGNLDNYDHLHEVRIVGKRLRYAMEVFVDCFGPAFRQELYPAVEQMQEVLGKANDSHVAAQRLGELRDRLRTSRPAEWRRFRPGVENLLRFHKERVPQQQQLFVEWRDRWQKAGGEEAFAGLLKRVEEPSAAT
jgi:CHAD domain-containing protein